jgi:amino acid transporter
MKQTKPSGVSRTSQQPAILKRSLSLPLLVMYGLGVTVGAGIYVLIGASAARAGVHAPISFLIAAGVMALTAASFAELSARMPVSAGEAAYVRKGFQSEMLSLAVGLMVILVGTVSAAAIAIGSAGYIKVFVAIPSPLLIALVVLAMAIIASWGIMESVIFAGIMTAVEILGLLINLWPCRRPYTTATNHILATRLACFRTIIFRGS